MTIPEIVSYVMALPVEDVRRLTATDVMGWTIEEKEHSWREDRTINVYRSRMYVGKDRKGPEVTSWRPDIDRNQSRQVTDKVREYAPNMMERALRAIVFPTTVGPIWWFDITPLDESRAALIAHMIHAEESKNATN